VHFLVKHNKNLQNARYAFTHDSFETSRSLRRRDFLDDESDYKLSIWTVLGAVSYTPIHTWNEAIDPIRSQTLLRKLEMSTTESTVRWTDRVSVLSDLLLVQWLKDAVSTAGYQLRTNKMGRFSRIVKV
jgi:hypothetical protein